MGDTIIGIVFIAIAFFLIFSVAQSSILKNKVLADNQKQDYQAVQLLRTYAQTPFELDGKTITVAEALNEYYILKNKGTSVEQLNPLLIKFNSLWKEITPQPTGLYSDLIYYSERKGSKFFEEINSGYYIVSDNIGGFATAPIIDEKSTNSQGYIILPANIPGAPAGSYKIILATSKETLNSFFKDEGDADWDL